MGNQSGVIFGAIAVAFVVYITLKGELPIYAGLLLLSPQGSGGTTTSSGNTQTSAAQAAEASQIAQAGTFALDALAFA